MPGEERTWHWKTWGEFQRDLRDGTYVDGDEKGSCIKLVRNGNSRRSRSAGTVPALAHLAGLAENQAEANGLPRCPADTG